ncbi:unnamed protein product [Phytomonas sp. Hart1]|nr:unnamed protein product [Phytomonas sp. Hart1]|eukprot:CCW69366.1 unnamed protein product [Phytomonas sp. isolate Hart1]
MRQFNPVVIFHRGFLSGIFSLTRKSFNTIHFSSNLSGSSDWVCGCGYSNFPYRKRCNKCGKTNKSLFQLPCLEQSKRFFEPCELREGDWMCQCGAHNFARRLNCVFCSKPHLPEVPKSSSKVFFPSKNTVTPLTDRFLPGDWVCNKCKSHNFKARSECHVCASPKIFDPEVQVSTWVCTACHASNLKGNEHCNVCGTQQPQRENSPLYDRDFSKSSQYDDWTCSRCGYLNFETRVQCKICKMEKVVFEKSTLHKTEEGNSS